MAERSLRQFVVLGCGKVLATLFGVLVAALVGRLLGPDGMGQWTLVVAAGAVLHTGLVSWTHSSTVRFGHEEWVRDHGLSRTLGARLPLLACSLALAILLVAADPARWIQRWFAVEPADRWMVAMFALSAWLSAEAQATLQATSRILWSALLAPLLGCLSMLALVLLFWSDSRALGLVVASITVFPSLGWGCAWVCSLTGSSTRPSRLVFMDVWRHLRYGAPMLPTLALGYISDWGDHLLLQRFSSVAQVGFFGMSYQFLVTMMAANGVLTTVLLPRLIAQEVTRPGSSRAYMETEVPTLYALWMIGTVWVIGVLPLVLGILLGPGFGESTVVLLILAVAIPSSVVTSLYSVLFSLQERLGQTVVYVFLVTFANISVSMVLIPAYGSRGAAVGTAVSYIVGQALYIRDQHRQFGVPVWRVATLWAGGLAIGASQVALGADAGLRVLWTILATAALAGLVRKTACVHDVVVRRIFGGSLQPVGTLINHVLVARP